jgi:COP9 signalosome complex subunit 6
MSRGEVALHPLVLVNISDHYTRVKQQQRQQQPTMRAIGAFVGIQDGANVSVLDSMEVIVDPTTLVVNLELLRRKLALTVAVFPRFEFLGWYLTGPVLPDQAMLVIQKQMQELNESPLVLIMDDSAISGAGQAQPSGQTQKKKVLPITVYETVMQRVNDQPVQTFVEVPVKVETTESERITVDHTATQKSSMGQTTSTLDPHMAALKNAVQMLKGRITILRTFLEMTKQGKIAPDHELLREAEAICNQLPAFDPGLLRKDFQTEMADALLVSLLASVTKETSAMSAVLEKFFAAFPTPGVGEEKTDRTQTTAAAKKGAAPSKGRMS